MQKRRFGRTGLEVPALTTFDDVEHALKAGPPNAYLDLFAARFYVWAARTPAGAKGAWYWDAAGAKWFV